MHQVKTANLFWQYQIIFYNTHVRSALGGSGGSCWTNSLPLKFFVGTMRLVLLFLALVWSVPFRPINFISVVLSRKIRFGRARDQSKVEGSVSPSLIIFTAC